uniref:hAT-like transposase RNase-H fold domain-containing protein n=1 Tax=Ananas comosus var. bracteatus TaxID=296719 RepID=A0A6V7PJJ0_ANACO|nr:unnamed protein product [Ananas comosus var. bracteatus]
MRKGAWRSPWLAECDAHLRCCRQLSIVGVWLPRSWSHSVAAFRGALVRSSATVCTPNSEDDVRLVEINMLWARAERIYDFLEPFYEITTLLSGSGYPTANLYFPSVWKIQKRLLEEAENKDEIISDMAKQMKSKFEKYWDNYSVILAIAIILDPRYKLPFVDYCFKMVHPTRHLEDAQGRKILTSQERVTIVRQELYLLFEKYAENQAQEKSSSTTNCSTSAKRKKDDIRMARDIMSIPITTVASEYALALEAKCSQSTEVHFDQKMLKF